MMIYVLLWDGDVAKSVNISCLFSGIVTVVDAKHIVKVR